MNGILLCNKTMTANYLHRTCGISIDAIRGQNCSQPEVLSSTEVNGEVIIFWQNAKREAIENLSMAVRSSA